MGKNGEGAKGSPFNYAMSLLEGKWKFHILWAISEQGVLRYSQIKRAIPGITDMMLGKSLKDMTADGLLERSSYNEIPPRVEYRLTPCTEEILPVLLAISDWGKRRLLAKESGDFPL